MKAQVIEQLPALTIAQLKRAGLFNNADGKNYGRITVTPPAGPALEIFVFVDLSAEGPRVDFAYKLDGRQVFYGFPLAFTPSNLNGTGRGHKGGYYSFVCPGLPQRFRKLYLLDGFFTPRFSFRSVYKKQTAPKSWRHGERGAIIALANFEDIDALPYRKLTYNGRATRYGKKYVKAAKKANKMLCAVYPETPVQDWDALLE